MTNCGQPWGCLSFLEEIMIGRQLDRLTIPELELQPPVGLAGIVREFGDVRNYVMADGTLDPRWEATALALVGLPFALALAWDPSRLISSFRCHRRLTDVFRAAFAQIVEQGLTANVHSFGGCFMYRPQRSSPKLSTHSWGIAIDLNPDTNRMGTAGDMPGDVVEVFRQAGFEWGGDWAGQRRDPMHFQFCSGY